MVVAIIGVLTAILLPALTSARRQAVAAKCLSNLRALGQGLALYVSENRDVLPPGRLPRIDNCNAYAMIHGRVKYRPTFLAMMSSSIGVPPFTDPQACRGVTDMFGEPGDRQNYSYAVYVCPAVPNWTDERNGSYGYNYQFLGNSRLLDSANPTSYKRWPVLLTQVRNASGTVAVADAMGTAASFPEAVRQPYSDKPPLDSEDRLGNEGFNLDPPRVDPDFGEMASAPDYRSAVDPRHRDQGSVLWVDGHASSQTLAQLGYAFNENGSVNMSGDNRQWSGNGRDEAWTPEFEP